MARLWYQDLGFSENPFSIKPGLFGNKLVGYDSIVSEICYRVDAGGMVFIDGPLGTGKTSLLRLIQAKYSGLKRVHYLSMPELKEKNLDELLFCNIGFWRRLVGSSPRGMIVLLDEVNDLPVDAVEKVKHYFDQDCIKTVVFTGYDYNKVPFPQSIRERINRSVVKISPLSPDEAVKIVRSRIGDKQILTDDIIKEMFKICRDNPRRLLHACEHVCRSAVESGASHVTREQLADLK